MFEQTSCWKRSLFNGCGRKRESILTRARLVVAEIEEIRFEDENKGRM